MKLTYVNQIFLDYRVPVLIALDHLVNQQLHVIYSRDAVPPRVHSRLQDALGDRAIGMTGERKFGIPDHQETEVMANQNITAHYQPGLYSKIISTNPDVVFGEAFFKWTVAALVAKAIRRIPLAIGYERTAYTERDAQWFRTFYRKSVLGLVDAMCCNGSLSLEYAVSLGMPKDRITLGLHAVDTEGLAHRANKTTNEEIEMLRGKWNTTGLVFVYVGQMIPRKGLKELLAGWHMFEEQIPEAASLVLIGGGPQKETLEQYCNEIALKHVHFAGTVGYEEIANCFASADALIMPTLEDNWSLVVPEAMACGLPILCSKYNGCWPELVDDGKNGWVFDPFDPNSILRCLKLLVEHKGSLETMGSKSQEMVEKFSTKNAAGAMLDACYIALDRHKRANG